MISDVLPDIPRVYTALAEWSAALVYILLIRKRLNAPRLAAAVAVGLAVLVGLQVAAGHFPIALWTLGMMLALAAMYALIYGCAEVSAKDAGYFVARAFVLAELVASLQWQLHTYLFRTGTDAPAVPAGLLLVGIFGVAFVGAFFIERRHFSPTWSLDVDTRGLLSAVAIALITFLTSNLSFVTTSTPFSGQRGTEIFYIRTLVDLAGYVALYAQQGQRLELRRAREVEAMDRLLHSQHEQYLQSRRSMEVVDRKYHDLKHYIAALRAEKDPVARTGYLNQLEDSIRAYGAQVDTGNSVLDAILTARGAQYAEDDVTLTCVADGQALGFMSAVDISALVGNALDNALEAVLAVDDRDRRLVQVAIFAQDGFVIMRFENYFEAQLDFDGDLPRTSKGDRRHHGYGLKNMLQIAESYGGTLTVWAEADWFTVRVLIPRPASS